MSAKPTAAADIDALLHPARSFKHPVRDHQSAPSLVVLRTVFQS
jgi:hypothetical protein